MKNFRLKYFVFIVVFFVALFSLSYCDTERYVNKDFGFSITPPAGWSIQDGKPYNLVVIFIGPAEGGFSPNFNLNIVDVPIGVSEINEEIIETIKSQLEALGDYLGTVDFISEGEREISKYKGYELEYFVYVGDDVVIEQKQVYLINNGKFYVFTFSSLSDTFDKYLPLFEQSLSSFEIF